MIITFKLILVFVVIVVAPEGVSMLEMMDA